MEEERKLPLLSDVEVRVLGALIEKSKTTPDYYPMTLNALTLACNQKSSRKPVVSYDEPTVVLALNSLKNKGFVSIVVGGTSRSSKYKHNFTSLYPLSDGEVALLCLLFLRGPQTPGELNSNAGKLYEFDSLELVLEILHRLSSSETPFVFLLPRRPGQKEARYTHLFTDSIEESEEHTPEEPARKTVSDLESRLEKVETELQEVKEKLEKLMKDLLG